MSNLNKGLVPVSQANAGVVRYINNAKKLGVPDMNNLKNRLTSANIRGMRNPDDWKLIQLMLTLHPMLSFLIANVIVVGRRKLAKLTGRAPSINNPQNRRLLTSTTNASLAVLNNPNALRKAINNAARIKNARDVVLIQNAIHTVVFGLITVMGTVEILNSYMSVSNLGPTTPADEFFDVAYNAIILMSRIVLPLILAIVQKVFKRSNTGTRAVILSSVAAVLVATQIDRRGLNILKGTVNNVRNSFMKLQNKAAFINKAVRLIDPTIGNKSHEMLAAAIIAARGTLRSIMQGLGQVILTVFALNKGRSMITAGRNSNGTLHLNNGRNNGTPRLPSTNKGTPRLTNGRRNINNNMQSAANALLRLRRNNNRYT